MGYERGRGEMQDLYLARDYAAPRAAVPFEFIDETSLIGPRRADRRAAGRLRRGRGDDAVRLDVRTARSTSGSPRCASLVAADRDRPGWPRDHLVRGRRPRARAGPHRVPPDLVHGAPARRERGLRLERPGRGVHRRHPAGHESPPSSSTSGATSADHLACGSARSCAPELRGDTRRADGLVRDRRHDPDRRSSGLAFTHQIETGARDLRLIAATMIVVGLVLPSPTGSARGRARSRDLNMRDGCSSAWRRPAP